MDGNHNLPVPQQCNYTPSFKACHSKNVWKELLGLIDENAQPEIKQLYDKCISQGNGPIRQVETCPDFFFFHCKVHTTKSTVKILAANTHRKYFLRIAEVTHFSVRGTACIRGLYNPL
jgi:hypothetical protein